MGSHTQAIQIFLPAVDTIPYNVRAMTNTPIPDDALSQPTRTQRFAFNWIVMGGVALAAVLLAGFLVAGLTSGGSYAYKNANIGLSAELTGRDWHTAKAYNEEKLEGDLLLRDDARFTFLAIDVKQWTPDMADQLRTLVSTVADGILAPTYTMGASKFQGFDGYEVNGTMPAGEGVDFKVKGHFFVANSRLYFVMAGNRSSDLNESGQQSVDKMLATVRVE